MAVLKVKEGLSAAQLDNLHVLEEWRLGLWTAEIRSLCLMALSDLRNGRAFRTVQHKLAHAISSSPEPMLQKYLRSQMNMMHFVLFEASDTDSAPGAMVMYLQEAEEQVEWVLPILNGHPPTNAPRQTQENLQSLCAVGLFLADLWGDLCAQTEDLPWNSRREGMTKAMRRTAADYLGCFELSAEVSVPIRKLLAPQASAKKFLDQLRQTVDDFWMQEGRLWSPLAE